jgi:hypothetical protein
LLNTVPLEKICANCAKNIVDEENREYSIDVKVCKKRWLEKVCFFPREEMFSQAAAGQPRYLLI